MVKYTCKRCGHIFDQKQHLERHINRKKPCNNLNDLIANIVDLKIDEKIKNDQLITKHNKGQYFTTNIYLKNWCTKTKIYIFQFCLAKSYIGDTIML